MVIEIYKSQHDKIYDTTIIKTNLRFLSKHNGKRAG